MSNNANAYMKPVGFLHPDAYARLVRGEPASCRSTSYGEPQEKRIYTQDTVDKLTKAVQGLLRVATRNDVPEAEQIAIAEGAVQLLHRLEVSA